MTRFGLVAFSLLVAACSSSSPDGAGGAGSTTSTGSSSPKTDAQYRDEAVGDMHDALLADIDDMLAAGHAIQSAAPQPSGRGWDATLDAAAIAATKDAWIQARSAYEKSEGALAPHFPNIDFAIDARYDDFVTQTDIAGGVDADLFDGIGFTGMHAMERILYQPETPAHVVTFEASLPNYVAATLPATEADAQRFATGLCAQFITDTETLKSEWTPAEIDVALAFQGLISLMNEQREKVEKAASDEEESRYAQRTMADLRDNLAGTRTVYAVFQAWLRSKHDAHDAAKDGPSIDAAILKGFDDLDAAYGGVSGAAIPSPPATWSAENPSATDLQTPFGLLYTAVLYAVDPTRAGSVVAEMNDAATVLGFPPFQVGP